MEKFNFEKTVKELVEAGLEAEIESHIANKVLQGKRNRKNGYNRKTVKSSSGEFELATPKNILLQKIKKSL